MPHWESVFGTDYEVPLFVRYLVQQKILQDTSYGNDLMPSFGIWDPASDRRVVLWVEHPMSRRRKNMAPTDGRFAVQDGDEVVFSSESLDLALESLFAALERFHRGARRAGPKEWHPARYKGVWNGKLAKLIKEYYDQ
jgi:hypothetical protein